MIERHGQIKFCRKKSPQKDLLAAPEASESTKISPIREDPSLENIVDVEKISTLFGNISDLVFSQIKSTLSPPKPTKGNIFSQNKPRVE